MTKNKLIFSSTSSFIFLLVNICLLCAEKVHFKYSVPSSPHISNVAPEEVEISIKSLGDIPPLLSNDTPPTIIRLKRVHSHTPSVPVYTLHTRPDGRLVCQRELLSERPNTGFYSRDGGSDDVIGGNDDVIQLTSFGDHVMMQRGELTVGQKRYRLEPPTRYRRSAIYQRSPSSPAANKQPASTSTEKVSSSSTPIQTEPTTSKPPPLSKQPRSTTTNPSLATIKPSLAATKPFLATTKPSLASTKPSIQTIRPSVAVTSEQELLAFTEQSQAAELHDFVIPPPVKTINSRDFASLIKEPFMVEKNSSILENQNIKRKRSTTQQSSGPHSRKRRQTAEYNIDTVAVIDYAIFKRFRQEADSRDEALEDIREYFAFMFTGVDLRYQSIQSSQYTIRVTLTKVIVAESTIASTFTENFRVADAKWDEVDASKALDAFRVFASGEGGEFLFPYDHATLFTGYDLTSSQGSRKTNSTTGLAYTSTLCRGDGYSVSVVEDLGGFQAVDTTAHEIGHSLSARHDGDGNQCKSQDRYIMAGGTYPETPTTRLHPWMFSPCSVSYFNSFISTTVRTSAGRTCLTQRLSVSASIPVVGSRLPGQEAGPDDQCRMIYGAGSRLCRGGEFGSLASLCTSMYCFDPATSGTCYEHTAARGTACGDGKICLDGECTRDARGSPMDESCPFGDQPGVAFNDLDCDDFVASYTGFCYQEVVKGRCCASCKAEYRPVYGCEYGDTVRGCDASVCRYASLQYKTQCCRTCGTGGDAVTTRDPNLCEDRPEVQVNGDACGVAIATNPQYCYQESVQSACCASCAAIATGRADCEFGDRYPLQCARISSCAGHMSECCQSCYGQTTPRRTTVTTTPVPACRDNPNILINQKTCQTAINAQPMYCYQDDVREACCASCAALDTGVADCQYGDRYTACSGISSCASYSFECCSTCRVTPTRSGIEDSNDNDATDKSRVTSGTTTRRDNNSAQYVYSINIPLVISLLLFYYFIS